MLIIYMSIIDINTLGARGFSCVVTKKWPARKASGPERHPFDSAESMNVFSVIRDLVMRTWLWDRQGEKIASRCKDMYEVELFFR